jgi:subtilisin-like proprotein convertase family protein
MNINGLWTLNISDRATSIIGNFTGWNFTVVEPSQINTDTTIIPASSTT